MKDPFRSVYREHDAETLAAIAKTKELATELYNVIDQFGAGEPRMISLSRTKLEEAVMWAVKGMTA